MRFLVFLLIAFILSACGATSTTGNNLPLSSPSPGSSSAPSSGVNNSNNFSEIQQQGPLMTPLVISAFGLVSGPSAAAFVAFYTDNRYAAGYIQKVSAQHYRVAANLGNYQQNGGTITTKQLKTSCIQLSRQYTGTSRVSGSVSGDSIVINNGSTSLLLSRVNLQKPSSNGAVVEWGCFDSAGNFTPQSWSDI